MKIHEYQAKRVLSEYGVTIPQGEVAVTPEEAYAAAARLGAPVVVKAQVHAGGRGKAGGVKLARTPEEAKAAAMAILGMTIKGRTVRIVLVEKAVEIAREVYIGVIFDRAKKAHTIIASAEGGIEIEELARTAPDKILKETVEPTVGLQPYQIRNIVWGMGFTAPLDRPIFAMVANLYRAFAATDASLAEINPLVITKGGEVLACDGKFNFDDNGMFRQKKIAEFRDPGEEDPAEREAVDKKLNFIKLDGNIGCMVNGAGLAMATMDMIKHFGAEPANFLDIGGGAKAQQVKDALSIILREPKVKAIFINIFGGIVRCDLVAEGIIAAKKDLGFDRPVVIRLIGTNDAIARKMLNEEGFPTYDNMPEAARKAVEMTAGV
ncbi:MAG: ADP-forming succinate--CoA ligase subunit beta [Candidatus Brocadiia bacterium]